MPHLKLAWVFVIMMVVVSAAMNFSFGWRLGEHSYTVTSHVHDGWIYGILSLAGDGFKIVMGVLTLTFFLAHTMPIGLRALGFLACGVLFVCATAYSLNSAIGSISMNRTDMAGVREAKATNYDAVKSQLDRVQKEQSWLDQGYRASAAVDADLAGLRQSSLWSRTAGCTDATVTESRSFCQRYTALQAELGTARRAEDLDGKADALRKQLAGMGGAVIADPHAKMLNQLTGYDQPTIVLAWLLLVVALVEGGSTIGPIALSMAHRAIQSREEARTAAKASDPISVAPAPVAAVQDPPATPRAPMKVLERLTGVKAATPNSALSSVGSAELVQSSKPAEPEQIGQISPNLEPDGEGTGGNHPDGPGTPIAKPEEPKIEVAEDPKIVRPAVWHEESAPPASPRTNGKRQRNHLNRKDQTVIQWLGDCCSITDDSTHIATGRQCFASYKHYCDARRISEKDRVPQNRMSTLLSGQLGTRIDGRGKRNGNGAVFPGLMINPIAAQARRKVA